MKKSRASGSVCLTSPNVGDRGQRYEVTFYDAATKKRQVFGWSNTEEGVTVMRESIKLHPSMSKPQVRDRQKGKKP